MLYEWDFESDGTWDYSGTDLVVEHTYPAYYRPDGSIDWDETAKDYTASLRVTDNSDPPLTDTDTRIVHITAPPWKPVADAGGPYYCATGPRSVMLDGAGSYDPESTMFPPDHPWYETLAMYEWDLDYDGEFDDSFGVNPAWDCNRPPGAYIVGLRVTDSEGSGPGGTIGPLDVGVAYTTVVVEECPDSDGDGICDAEDECRDEPEDLNGSDYDDDGCPSWSFAVITDLHVGRYWEDDGEEYYLTQRLKDTVTWIREQADDLNIKFAVVLGDLSNGGKDHEEQLGTAKEILDSLGADLPYVPLVGNHDIVEGERKDDPSGREPFSRIFHNQFEQIDGFFEHFDLLDVPKNDFLGFAFTYDDAGGPARFIALDFSGGGGAFAGNAYMNEVYVNTRLQGSPPAGAPVFVLAHHPLGTACSGFLPGQARGVLDTIAKGSKGSTVMTLGGHVHGFPPSSVGNMGSLAFMQACRLDWGSVFDANQDELRVWNNGVQIRSLTTEALMVGSNQLVGTPPKDKGFVRIVQVEGKQVLSWGPPVSPYDKPAFNPHFDVGNVQKPGVWVCNWTPLPALCRGWWLTFEAEPYTERAGYSCTWEFPGAVQIIHASECKAQALYPRRVGEAKACLTLKSNGNESAAERICRMVSILP